MDDSDYTLLFHAYLHDLRFKKHPPVGLVTRAGARPGTGCTGRGARRRPAYVNALSGGGPRLLSTTSLVLLRKDLSMQG